MSLLVRILVSMARTFLFGYLTLYYGTLFIHAMQGRIAFYSLLSFEFIGLLMLPAFLLGFEIKHLKTLFKELEEKTKDK